MSGKPAARVSDPTACPIPGHATNPIVAGSADVLFDSLPAARMGDASACGGKLASNVIPTVLINGKPATTVGTLGNHGNVVIGGSGTVIIGNSHTPAPFTAPVQLVQEGFDRLFSFETADGQPITDINYRIQSESGAARQGSTSSSGLTNNFPTGSRKENLTIYISGE